MDQHGLTLADLQAAGCFTEPPPALLPGAVRYRNAHGQGWDGRGAMAVQLNHPPPRVTSFLCGPSCWKGATHVGATGSLESHAFRPLLLRMHGGD